MVQETVTNASNAVSRGQAYCKTAACAAGCRLVAWATVERMALPR